MLELNFTPFPELATERLLLRKLTLDDAPEIFFLRSDPAVLRYLGREPAIDVQEAENFIKTVTANLDNNEGIIWGITEKNESSKIIGTICYWNITKEHYRTEIGYALHPAYWGKGIMKEAIKSVLEYGFGHAGFHSVEARLSSGNRASAAVLEATGFVKEAHFREDFYFRGKFEDTLVYSILRKG